jgi:integrase
MGGQGGSRAAQEALLAELEGIRDIYMLDVRQFVRFLRERKLTVVEGFRQFGDWLEEEHGGKRYSASTINRKIAAARSRIRYAFKLSAHAGGLRRKYHLEDVLKMVKLKKIETVAVPADKVLDIEEARALVRDTKDQTIRLMVTFLVSTGVRVSEMLGLLLSDMREAKGMLVSLRVRGKGGRERIIHVQKAFVDRIRRSFQGQTHLFEHHGRTYNRISVTNRIKHESLRILGREVTTQQLRHTWAAIQIKRGRDVNAVAAVLGHADPGLTARMYSRTRLEPEEAYLDLDDGGRSDLERMDDGGGRHTGEAPRAPRPDGPHSWNREKPSGRARSDS